MSSTIGYCLKFLLIKIRFVFVFDKGFFYIFLHWLYNKNQRKTIFLLRQATILFISFAFLFSTIDELVKLCFSKIECVQELIDLDDSESGDFEKDADLDTIFQNTTYYHFEAIFIIKKLSFIPNHSQNYDKQVIYTIVSPPPEV